MILKFKYFTHGGSTLVNVAVFTGSDKDHLTLAGRLVLAQHEWAAFKNLKAADKDQIIYEKSEFLV